MPQQEPVTLLTPEGTRYVTDDPAEIVTLRTSYGYTVATEEATTQPAGKRDSRKQSRKTAPEPAPTDSPEASESVEAAEQS